MGYLKKLTWVLFVCLIAMSYGKDDDSSSQGLSGKIRGVEFTAGAGRFVDFGGDHIVVVI